MDKVILFFLECAQDHHNPPNHEFIILFLRSILWRSNANFGIILVLKTQPKVEKVEKFKYKIDNQTFSTLYLQSKSIKTQA